MFSNTLSFLSSRNVNNQVSHPYKTTGKIIASFKYGNKWKEFGHYQPSTALLFILKILKKMLKQCANMSPMMTHSHIK